MLRSSERAEVREVGVASRAASGAWKPPFGKIAF